MAQFRVELWAAQFGSQILNRLHLTSGLTASAIATEFQTTYLDFVRGIHHPTYVYTRIVVAPLDIIPAPAPFVLNVSVPGVQNQTPLPPQAAITFRLRTGLAGRRFKGRIKYGGLSSGLVAGQTLTSPDGINLYNARRDMLLGRYCNIPSGTWTTPADILLHVRSIENGTWHQVTSIDYDTIVSTQNSRRPGRGI